MPNRYRCGNDVSSALLPEQATMFQGDGFMLASMVTKIRTGARVHFYLREHREAKGLGIQQVAGRIDSEEYPDGVSRETVWRWENEQQRLTPDKIAAYADAIGIEDWIELTRLPNQPSLDAILKDSPKEVIDMAADIVRRLAGQTH